MSEDFEFAEQDTTMAYSDGVVAEQDVYADSEGTVLADTWAADNEGNFVEEIDYLQQ